MISNSAELELLFMTLRQQAAPSACGSHTRQDQHKKKDTLWSEMPSF